MTEKKKIMYVQTSGLNTPERLYSPFVLAATAKSTDLDAIIYFLGMGITVVKKGAAETVKAGAFPPLSGRLHPGRELCTLWPYRTAAEASA